MVSTGHVCPEVDHTELLQGMDIHGIPANALSTNYYQKVSGKGKMNKSVFGLGNILAKVVGLGNFFS